MATLKDLFKSQKKELYGKSEAIRIDSRGLINPPRGAALLLASPDALGDLIGGQLTGLAGNGSANRPSDTIFKGKSFLSKPISLFKTPNQLRNAVEAGTDYYVKPAPSPNSIISTIKQGASSPLGTALEIGTDLIKGLKDRNPTRGLPYGEKDQNKERKTFSKFYTKYNDSKEALVKVVGTIEERKGKQLTKWDNANDYILSTESLTEDELNKKKKEYELQNQVWVTFKKYGDAEIIPFNGTISGITEDITPEWTNFRYLGSPFKSYRYLGVERILNFEMKLYYNTEKEKNVMIKKINYLKSLAFPYEQVAEIQLNTNQENPTNAPLNSQYAFSPNLIYLSIGDLYNNIFGFVETLSFTIDENTTWPSFNSNLEEGKDNTLYPSVITVAFGVRIIETHKTEKQKGGITKYKYNFNGK